MRADDLPDDGLDAAAVEFALLRPRLFGIAYRILGNVAAAEDIVQEAWLRWQQTDRTDVVSPVAFLSTVATRLAINAAQSAYARRETYVGPWLPEPVDTSHDPALGAERSEAVHLAVLMVLERLSPSERAAYVLREAFDYSHRDIADILQLTEANSRQLVARARRHIHEDRRGEVDRGEHQRLLGAFLAAAKVGDVARLESVLAQDVINYSDGGGIARTAARIPVHGRTKVAKFVAAFADQFWVSTTHEWIEANGKPALLLTRGESTVAVLTVDVSTHGIERIMWVMNPDKLRSIGLAAVGRDPD